MTTAKIDPIITETIKQGLIKGYRENICFTQNYTGLQTRIIEYLIVVNIAQCLYKLCVGYGITINLEHPLNVFRNNAFPRSILRGSNIFNLDIHHSTDHTLKDCKSPRIDIALCQDIAANGELTAYPKSLFGIEVKAINHDIKRIRTDVERLSETISLKDKISENFIYSCFVCFFKRYDTDNKTISKSEISKKITKEKEYWCRYFLELAKYSPLQYELIHIEVESFPAEEYSNELCDDYSEFKSNTGYVAAYIIKIMRK